LWFTESSADKVGKITTAGVITEYPVKGANLLGSITSGPDGNLWFEFLVIKGTTLSGSLAKITTSGVLTIVKQGYPVGTGFGGKHGNGFVAGSDGAFWLDQGYPNSLARVTTSGVVSEVALSSANACPSDLAVGADKKLWVVEACSGTVERLSAIGGAGKTIAATHGVSFSGAVASYTDGTTTATASDFTASIVWGDGSKTSGAVAGSSGSFTVSGTYTYANAVTSKSR